MGAQYVYSDLSFITLMYVVGHVVRENALISTTDMHNGACQRQNLPMPTTLLCHFEAFVRTRVLPSLGAANAQFWPQDASRCAPTTNDTTYRHEVVQVGVSCVSNDIRNNVLLLLLLLFAQNREMFKIQTLLLWAVFLDMRVFSLILKMSSTFQSRCSLLRQADLSTAQRGHYFQRSIIILKVVGKMFQSFSSLLTCY